MDGVLKVSNKDADVAATGQSVTELGVASSVVIPFKRMTAPVCYWYWSAIASRSFRAFLYASCAWSAQ